MTYNKLLLTGVASLAIVAIGGISVAKTIVTDTTVKTKDLENVQEVNFKIFDTNNDGSYSMAEVGERLFESFDRNQDNLLDNLEWDNKTVMTITPMEEQTFKFIDYNDDGYTDESTYSYTTFYQASGLSKFDENQNGLSAYDFVEETIQELDQDEDNLINMTEWKEAYLGSRPDHEKEKNYNE